jgi:C4-type Zn-finger protein
MTIYDSPNMNHVMTKTTVCRRCLFHPASTRIAGYCSWDCYEADDEADTQVADDVEGTTAARGAALADVGRVSAATPPAL